MRMKHADHGVYYCDSNDGLKTVKSVMSMMVLKTVKSVVSMRAMLIKISVISALFLTTVISMMLHKIWECIVKKAVLYQCNGFFVSASIPANQRLVMNVNASILQRISCPLQGTHTTAIFSQSNTVCTVHSAPKWFSEYQKKCRLKKAEDQVTSVE